MRKATKKKPVKRTAKKATRKTTRKVAAKKTARKPAAKTTRKVGVRKGAKLWTKAEESQLRTMYKTKTTPEIAKALGRSVSSVKSKARALGLKKPASARRKTAAKKTTTRRKATAARTTTRKKAPAKKKPARKATKKTAAKRKR